jgi:hypothetical protein
MIGFLIGPPLKPSPNDNSRKGLYTYPNRLINLELIIFWDALQFKATMSKLAHLSHGFTPTNACPTKNSNRRCVKHVAFECHANF